MKNKKYILSPNDYQIRNIDKMSDINKGDRTLKESIMSPEVNLALNDWIDNNINNCVLIGGIALSYYVKPRYTEDIDILFLSKMYIPETLNKFKKHRPSAFQHNKTHVEVEVVTPELINTPIFLVATVFVTAIIKDGIKIASPSGLIALKLGRFNLQDQADIYALIKCSEIDLTPFKLPDELLDKYEKIKNYKE